MRWGRQWAGELRWVYCVKEYQWCFGMSDVCRRNRLSLMMLTMMNEGGTGGVNRWGRNSVLCQISGEPEPSMKRPRAVPRAELDPVLLRVGLRSKRSCPVDGKALSLTVVPLTARIPQALAFGLFSSGGRRCSRSTTTNMSCPPPERSNHRLRRSRAALAHRLGVAGQIA